MAPSVVGPPLCWGRPEPVLGVLLHAQPSGKSIQNGSVRRSGRTQYGCHSQRTLANTKTAQTVNFTQNQLTLGGAETETDCTTTVCSRFCLLAKYLIHYWMQLSISQHKEAYSLVVVETNLGTVVESFTTNSEVAHDVFKV